MLIFEGRLAHDLRIKDVLRRIQQSGVQGDSVLRFHAPQDQHTGYLIIEDAQCVVAAVTKSKVKGYSAARALLCSAEAKFQYYTPSPNEKIGTPRNLYLSLERIIQRVPDLPPDQSALFDQEILMERLFRSTLRMDQFPVGDLFDAVSSKWKFLPARIKLAANLLDDQDPAPDVSSRKSSKSISKSRAERSEAPTPVKKLDNLVDSKTRRSAKSEGQSPEESIHSGWKLFGRKVTNVISGTSSVKKLFVDKEEIRKQEARRLPAIDLANALFELAHRLVELRWQDVKDVEIRSPVEMLEPQWDKTEPSLITYYRWRISTPRRTFSVRATYGSVETFIVPTEDVIFKAAAEYPTRRLASFERLADNSRLWEINGELADSSKIFSLMESWLTQLFKSPGKADEDKSVEKKSASDLLAESDHVNLVFRMLQRQEELKNEIAREIHDSIIGDLMLLKGKLQEDKLGKTEMLESLDHLLEQLRDICNDYAPRMQDWGLRLSLEAFLSRFEERHGIDCTFVCDDELPQLPAIVQSNLFRIVQESVTNAAKHAEATRIIVKFDYLPKKTLTCTIKDNGKGFSYGKDLRPIEGGHGLKGMEERVQLIRTIYPAALTVSSERNKGSEIVVVISL